MTAAPSSREVARVPPSEALDAAAECEETSRVAHATAIEQAAPPKKTDSERTHTADGENKVTRRFVPAGKPGQARKTP